MDVANPKNSIGSWRTYATILLAFTSLFVVVDIAIETLLTNSPLRISVAVLVGIYVALFLTLSFKRPSYWQMLSWADRAILNVTFAIGVICLSTGHPSGLSNGISILTIHSDNTPTVLLAIALILVGAYVLTWRRIPKALRATLAGLILYSLAGLFLGLSNGTSFLQLMQGGAFAASLPVWFQSATVGAFIALPAAALVSITRLTAERQFISVAGRWLIVISTTFVLVPPMIAMSVGTSTPLVPKYTSVDDLQDKLTMSFEYLDRYYENIDREYLDANAVLKRIGKDPSAILNFVQLETVMVPYLGSLRGAQGVLADRLGNSLDRSLLLQDLLSRSGHRTRVARATLSLDTAHDLLAKNQRGLEIKDHSAKLKIDLDEMLERLGVDRYKLGEGLNDDTEMERAIARAHKKTEMQSVYLESVSHDSAHMARDSRLKDLTEHWWVQIRSDGKWLDMDPAGVISSDSLRPANTRFYDGQVPTNQIHKVKISVGIEYEKSGSSRTEVLLEHVFDARNYVDQTIRLINIPNRSAVVSSGWEDLPLDTIWMPILADGENIFINKVFSIDGNVKSFLEFSSPSGHSDKIENVIDFFGSLTAADMDMPSSVQSQIKLRSQWVDFKIIAPGESDRTHRRMILDSGGAETENHIGVNLALATVTDIAIQSASINDQFLEAISVRTMSEYGDQIEQLLKAVNGRTASQFDEKAAALSPNVMELFVLARMRNIAPGTKSQVFLSQPNVLALHTGTRRDIVGKSTGYRAFDIVDNRVSIRNRADPRAARLYQGIWDTWAEALVMGQIANRMQGILKPNAASLLDIAEDSSWRTLKSNGTNVGRTIVQSSQINYQWVIEGDGTTLGIGPLAWGAATAETSVLMEFTVDYAICLGSALVGVELKATTVAPNAMLCMLGGIWSTAAAIELGGRVGWALSKIIPVLVGQLPALLDAADESRPDASGRWPGESPPRPGPSTANSDSSPCVGPCMEYVEEIPANPDWFTDR